jgi:predicted amidohydrolase
MLLYMPRFFVQGPDANLAALRRDCNDAAEAGADIVMFPEMFLTGYRGANDPAVFRTAFAEISAASPETLYVFGAISEDGHNRLPVYRGGAELLHYDKVHLFEPNGEHELWEPGSRYAAVAHGGINIGLATCNDVRFPEQARALKLKHDVRLLLYPALWPWQRDHVWAGLLRARAMENAVFCAGCCIAGIDNGAELFDGAGNHLFDPLGEPIQPRGRVYRLDLARLDDVLVDTRAQYREISEIDYRG